MSLKKVLAGTIPPEKLALFSDRFEVIGDIALITIPPELDAYQEDIALALISQRRNIRTVLRRSGMAGGEERVVPYEVIIGSGTRTEHREYGFRYQLDVATVFFTSRLATERMRVTGLVSAGERVLVPFPGVGPFVVPAADRGARVVAVEKHPAACCWLHRNLALNRVSDRVEVICDDVFRIPDLTSPGFDRVISPTPYGLDGILPLLSAMTLAGGIIHFYTFKKDQEIDLLSRQLSAMGLRPVSYHRCGYVAPGVGRYVFDLEKEREP